MKIFSWNVNGLRSIARKGFRTWMDENDPDILCLQEIKARPEQVDKDIQEIPGYFSYWNPAEKPGYSGVALFTKEKPLSALTSIGHADFDSEGRVIIANFNCFTIINVYFPNGQRGLHRLNYKLQFYDHLGDILRSAVRRGDHLILTGDFNTAHTNIDLANPAQNSNNSGFLPEERAKIDLYLSMGLMDIFRHQYPTRVQYSWWTYRFGARERNIGWRIDYFLVTKNLIDSIVKTEIMDQVSGSDHCPIMLELKEPAKQN